MTAIAIYARYSSDQQREASIEDQIRLCQERAAKEGWRVHNCYTDHGVSGASLMRPGMQMLLQDAVAGKFRIILAEALDRLSRDQEDIAGLFKRMRFADIRIITLSEGEISNLHIGLKGTMNALYLQDLADKTRRGLRGRVEAGKSGGGLSYGYDVVKQFREDGSLHRGERVINESEAAVIRRIFEEYATGASPKAIVKGLNRDGIPSPSGRGWGPSTLHGNRQRGTGLLNNELYIGRLVWNRLRFIKDPDTGKRVPRPNPESAWIVHEVPELRIIDQELWEKVKARQDALHSERKRGAGTGFWDRRRPRYLFSGLLKCGVCGGAYVKVGAAHFACTTARTKGMCGNRLRMHRDVLESAVLDGLQHRLMDPELCAAFCEEYTRHRNKLRMEANAAREGYRSELKKVRKEIDRLIEAIIDGVPGARVKDRIGALEDRKTELEALLSESREEPVLMHPNMASYYRKEVAALREALNDPDRRSEAAELIRNLVERIVLTPVKENGSETLSIDLYGALAGILAMARGEDGPLPAAELEKIKLVAGEGFEPPTPGL